MWFCRLLCLGIVPAFCAIAGTDLQKEDLRSVQQAIRKKDAGLNWFAATAKESLDATRSVIIVQAAPTETTPCGPQGIPKLSPVPGKTQTGVFVVAGRSNRVLLVLDIFPNNETRGGPTIGQAGVKSLNLHFYDDYGIYGGSIKYVYDLSSGKPPLKFPYGMLALTSSKFGRSGWCIPVLLWAAYAVGDRPSARRCPPGI